MAIMTIRKQPIWLQRYLYYHDYSSISFPCFMSWFDIKCMFNLYVHYHTCWLYVQHYYIMAHVFQGGQNGLTVPMLLCFYFKWRSIAPDEMNVLSSSGQLQFILLLFLALVLFVLFPNFFGQPHFGDPSDIVIHKHIKDVKLSVAANGTKHNILLLSYSRWINSD